MVANARDILKQLERINAVVREITDQAARARLASLVESIAVDTGMLPFAATEGLDYEPQFVSIELHKEEPVQVTLRPEMQNLASQAPASMQRQPCGTRPRIAIESDQHLELIIRLAREAARLEGIVGPSRSSGPRIVSTPGVCGGRPRIRGTRVRVADVLDMLASGMGEGEIVRDYPYITHEDIEASLRYARQFVDLPVLGAPQ